MLHFTMNLAVKLTIAGSLSNFSILLFGHREVKDLVLSSLQTLETSCSLSWENLLQYNNTCISSSILEESHCLHVVKFFSIFLILPFSISNLLNAELLNFAIIDLLFRFYMNLHTFLPQFLKQSQTLYNLQVVTFFQLIYTFFFDT